MTMKSKPVLRALEINSAMVQLPSLWTVCMCRSPLHQRAPRPATSCSTDDGCCMLLSEIGGTDAPVEEGVGLRASGVELCGLLLSLSISILRETSTPAGATWYRPRIMRHLPAGISPRR